MSPRAGTAVSGDVVDDRTEGLSDTGTEDKPVATGRRRPRKVMAPPAEPAADSGVIFFDDVEDPLPSDGPEADVVLGDGPGTSTAVPSSSPGSGSWVRSHLGTVSVGVVTVALAVVLVLTLLDLGNKNALSSARSSALATARTDAVELAGYNYRHLNADFAVVMSHSTPTFRRSFSQASDALKGTLTRYHATANAKVVSAGLVSATTGRAVALVFLTQKIKNSTQSAATTTDRSQVEITLVDSQGKWLINNVSLL